MKYVIESSENFLLELEKFSDKKLNERETIHNILHFCLNSDSFSVFEETAFTAKYINGLLRVMKSAVGMTDVQNLDTIKQDLSKNYEKFVNQMQVLIDFMPEEDREPIRKKYLEMTSDSFDNLNSLITDFELCKIYLNHLKRK